MKPTPQSISFPDYQAHDGLNATAIVAGHKSMKHMHYAIHGPAKKDTPGMKWGRWIHGAVLEPDVFLPTIAIWDGTKKGKAYDEFLAANSTKTIMHTDERDKLLRCRDAVHGNKDAAFLIKHTDHEQSIFWSGENTGECKARLDAFSAQYGIMDLKTTARIDKEGFARIAHNLGYMLKLGWYGCAASMVTGNWPPVHIISLEQDGPQDCVVYHVPDYLVVEGFERALEIVKLYRICEVVGEFAGVADGIVEFELPLYASVKPEDWEVK